MFIYNVKLSKTTIIKVLFIIIAIVLILFFGISAYRIFSESINSNIIVTDSLKKGKTANITATNYTNILKTVHDDLDTYIGQKICFSGYVYRVSDFTKEQFVLARDMVISSDFQTLIVGFLCNCEDAYKYKDKSWVEITGTITKGNYHGDIPIIEIESIKSIDKPSDEYVYPPDDSYVPTSILF